MARIIIFFMNARTKGGDSLDHIGINYING